MKRFVKAAAALITAAVMAAAPLTVFAEKPQVPDYEFFNSNDVNGVVNVVLPEGVNGGIKITFDSPEGLDEKYYDSDAVGGDTYTFEIEGRDNTGDDYRTYRIKAMLFGGKYESSCEYTSEFTIPDGNDNPDSFTTITYNFEVDDKIGAGLYDEENDGKGNITVMMHLDAFLKGDLDGNGRVEATDASMVLEEYASQSTVGVSVLTNLQKEAANVDGDKRIGADDASLILEYYSAASTGTKLPW